MTDRGTVSEISCYLISRDCVSQILNKFASQHSFTIKNLIVVSRILDIFSPN